MPDKFKIGDIVKFTPGKQLGRNLQDFYGLNLQVVHLNQIKRDLDDEETQTILLIDLSTNKPFFTKSGNATHFFNGSYYEAFYDWRFYLFKEGKIKDPILLRINKLYKKCKTTQHWTVEECQTAKTAT